jgi:hypothetical protein
MPAKTNSLPLVACDPLPAAVDGDFAVAIVHFKSAWDQHWEAHQNASKLVDRFPL